MEAAHITEIERERRRLMPNTAERLPRYFNTTLKFSITLPFHCDLNEFEAGEEVSEIASDFKPRKGAAARN